MAYGGALQESKIGWELLGLAAGPVAFLVYWLRSAKPPTRYLTEVVLSPDATKEEISNEERGGTIVFFDRAYAEYLKANRLRWMCRGALCWIAVAWFCAVMMLCEVKADIARNGLFMDIIGITLLFLCGGRGDWWVERHKAEEANKRDDRVYIPRLEWSVNGATAGLTLAIAGFTLQIFAL